MLESYRQAIEDFEEAAIRFCRLIESCQEMTLDKFIFDLDSLLPEIYQEAHALVASAPDDLLKLDIDVRAPEIEFQELLAGQAETEGPWRTPLRNLLGSDDTHYIGVSYVADAQDGELPETEVLDHSTSSELSEMYDSIRDGLSVFRQPDVENAGRDWIFGFYKWGEYVPHILGETFRLAHATISEEEANEDL